MGVDIFPPAGESLSGGLWDELRPPAFLITTKLDFHWALGASAGLPGDMVRVAYQRCIFCVFNFNHTNHHQSVLTNPDIPFIYTLP